MAVFERFADYKVLKYDVPGFEKLPYKTQQLVYYLCKAAYAGQEMHWFQKDRRTYEILKAFEKAYFYNTTRGEDAIDGKEWDGFLDYYRAFYAHHGLYNTSTGEKLVPNCSRESMRNLLMYGSNVELILKRIYDPDVKSDDHWDKFTGFYNGVKRASDAKEFYAAETAKRAKSGAEPIPHGLNTELCYAPDQDLLYENIWNIDHPVYGPYIEKIVHHLTMALMYTENSNQSSALSSLSAYLRSGSLDDFNTYTKRWLEDTESIVDIRLGFIEQYDDPIGIKGIYEGVVTIVDPTCMERVKKLQANAQWFEDRSPVNPVFRKPEAKGVSAYVVHAVALAGHEGQFPAIRIILPNEDYMRDKYGSKSITLQNIINAYDAADAVGKKVNEWYSPEDYKLIDGAGSAPFDLHVDLHEALGHASGRNLPGVDSSRLGEYMSILEEARAELFGLYWLADPKIIELGLLKNREQWMASYVSDVTSALITQFARVPKGQLATQAHMRARLMYTQWVFANPTYQDVIKCEIINGKSYIRITDYDRLRAAYADCLYFVQTIKSTGDFEAGKIMVEVYGTRHLQSLSGIHDEVVDRFEARRKLDPNISKHTIFINPHLINDPVTKCVHVCYPRSFLDQIQTYGMTD